MTVAPTHAHQLILNGFLNEKKKKLSGTLLHSTSWAQTNGSKSHSGGTSGRLRRLGGEQKKPLQNRKRRKGGQEAGGPADGDGKNQSDSTSDNERII